MRDLQIMPMQARHVAAVAALESACFSDPWSARSIEGELTNPLSLWLIAEVNGTAAGYIGSQTVGDAADMMNVAVDPAYRRQGVAQKLLDALWQALCARGAKTLTLEVRASNAAAIALYEKNAYVQIGRRPGYYRHPKEDALILQKGEELG